MSRRPIPHITTAPPTVYVSNTLFWAVRLGAAFIFLFGLSFFILSAIPWQPLIVHDMSARPPEVCAGRLTEMRIDAELKRGLPPAWRDVRVEVYSSWENKVTGKRTPEQKQVLRERDFGGYGRGWRESMFLRKAPELTGMWHPTTRYVVSGSPLYVRRHYEFRVTGKSWVTTINPDLAECKE